MKEIPVRCPFCGRMLMNASEVVGTIKCPRCRKILLLRLKRKVV